MSDIERFVEKDSVDAAVDSSATVSDESDEEMEEKKVDVNGCEYVEGLDIKIPIDIEILQYKMMICEVKLSTLKLDIDRQIKEWMEKITILKGKYSGTGQTFYGEKFKLKTFIDLANDQIQQLKDNIKHSSNLINVVRARESEDMLRVRESVNM